MPTNYVLLEKITVGATAVATVAFSGIPQTGYTDLVVKASIRSSRSSTNDAFYVYFNTDTTAANYKLKLLYGTGAAANSYTSSTYNDSTGWISGNSTTASTFSNSEFYIPNYTSANAKSVSYDSVGENNATDAHMGITASSWSGTAAINKITIGSANGANFMQYSTFYLYGVAKLNTTPAIAPYATGGDTIMTDGTYWYHAFKASGTFTPVTALSCDVLVVAGGGSGGGGNGAGGGGAGGLYYSSGNSIASAQTVTIGAGAAGKTVGGNGFNGSNSQFGSLTAAVGGGYGAGTASNGQAIAGGSGGSGGGACSSVSGGAATGGTATSGQGNAGGNAQTGGRNGGGGGGAGAAGGNGVSEYTGGVGGVGSSAYSSWGLVTGTGQNVSGTVYYAGGGGGWSGAVGGYGGGAAGSLDLAATANTGGGGGSNNGQLGAGAANGGGSGIVIVRYAV